MLVENQPSPSTFEKMTSAEERTDGLIADVREEWREERYCRHSLIAILVNERSCDVCTVPLLGRTHCACAENSFLPNLVVLLVALLLRPL